MEKKPQIFMLAPLYKVTYFFVTGSFLLQAVGDYMSGRYVSMLLHLLISCVACVVSVRYFVSPTIALGDSYVEFISRPIFPTRRVNLSDIINLERDGKKFKLVLSNRKRVPFPIAWLKKEERDLVVSLVNSKISPAS
jgi:hypothetical protein